MATYNGARFVERQLESILGQTLLPTEVLVGDDGSVDDTVEIVRKVLTGRPVAYDVRVNERRLGVTANFERLIGRAAGDLIVLSDQDDEWLPDRLEIVQDVFLTQPHVAGVFTNAELIGPGSEALGGSLWDAVDFAPRDRRRWAKAPFDVLMGGNVVTGATLAFRSEARPRFLPFSVHGWHDYWIAMLLASRGELVALDQPVVRYRLHGANQAGVSPRGLARFRSRSIGREGARREQLAQLGELADRLAAMGRPLPPSLTGRIAHLRFRDSLPAENHRRALALLRHGRLADYWRFSSGWLSLALDITQGGRPNRES
jgi:glycosyltransferase involved in cell wall biosynthesis